MSHHLSHDLAFDWQADTQSGLETDRMALADQVQLCQHALSPRALCGTLVDRAQAFLVPRIVSLILVALLLLAFAASVG